MAQDDKATFGDYLVGVFDVLGQSSKLREQTRSTSIEDPAERQRILANLKDTAGVVLGFRKLFANFFDGMDNAPPSPLLRFLPPHQQVEMLAATASEIVRWGVSDSIFVAVPLARTRHPAASVADMFRSLLAAATMWMAGLSTNHPIRGGMEIGTGIDIAPGEVYGQALEAAYRLESRVAQLPRIVVGPQCIEFLEGAKHDGHLPHIAAKMAAANADLCLSMLRRDADGSMSVDALGQVMRKESERIPDLRNQFSRAHDNVRDNFHRFRDADNRKLASRYQTLLAYFDERAPMWSTLP